MTATADYDETPNEPESINEMLREFLEKHPLYAPARFNVYKSASLFRPSQWPNALMLPCGLCDRETTWARETGPERQEFPGTFFDEDHRSHHLLVYKCVRCEDARTAYWCLVEYIPSAEVRIYTVRKQGQSPAWSIAVPSSIKKALPAEASGFYRKGVICLSQDFGLAAVGYFRRVVEEVTDHLLNLVEQHAQSIGNTATVEAVQGVRRSHQATDRLKYAASQLPVSLRAGGRNPLADLYDKYSEGIHSMTDEECLAVGLALRAALDYLLPALHEQLQAAREYEAALTKTKRRAKTNSGDAQQ